MKRLWVLLCVMAVSLWALSTAGAAGSMTGYRLVFAAGGVGDSKIYMMDTDGRNVFCLSSPAKVNDEMPACSPDGKRIAFVSHRDGNAELYIMDSDGRNQTRLTRTNDDEGFPSFSGDGRNLLFDRQARNGRHIFTLDLQTMRDKKLTDGNYTHVAPKFSPNGTRIAFSSDRDGTGRMQIYVMNNDGSGIVQLTRSDSGSCYTPSWSPDGRSLVFDYGTIKRNLYIIGADGTNLKKITGTDALYLSPCWSPDGSKIAFAADLDGLFWELYTVNPDGTGLVMLTERYSFASDVAWISAPQTQSGTPTFRQTFWGMTRAQVREAENAPFIQEYKGDLTYRDTVNGLECTIVYMFDNDVLTEAAYVVTEVFTDQSRYIDEYRRLKDLLTRKYGTPLDDQIFWKNSQYKDTPKYWGLAVGLGHVQFFAEWESEQTDILLALKGEKSRINLVILYSAKGSSAEEIDISDL